jgi:competence protein ComGC
MLSHESILLKKKNKQVIALGVICVILAASLVGFIALYRPVQINDQQATIDALEQQLELFRLNQTDIQSSLAQIASLKSQLQQYANLNDSLAGMYADLADYEQLLSLQKSSSIFPQQTVTQNPNSVTTIYTGTTIYAGYVIVQVTSSNANSTYAQVIYRFGETNSSYNQTIGTSGTALLPVLPSTEADSFKVLVGNTQTDIANATAIVSAVFYY